MKRLLLLALMLLLPLTSLRAEQLDDNQKWIESIDGAVAFPSSDTISRAFDVGLGGDISMGYRFTPLFSISASVGYYYYNVQSHGELENGQLGYIPLMVVFRFNLMQGPVRPYVSLGTGVAINTYYNSSTGLNFTHNQTCMLLAPALGVMFRVVNGVSLFAQARFDIDMTSTSIGNTPLDEPSIYVPLQFGASFFVL